MEHGGEANTSGRDPRHLFEDAVEENGDEQVPYSNYYEGGEDFPIKPCDGSAEETALVLSPLTKYHTMAVIPGKMCRTILDTSSSIIVLIFAVLQMGLLDHYYFKHIEHWAKYTWLGLDFFAFLIFVGVVVSSIKYNRNQMEEVCSVDAKVKYAWISWGAYSLLLAGKVATCFRMFHHELPPGPLDNNDKFFDDQLFKLGLSLSVLIFIFLLEANHYTPIMSTRQLYISYLTTAICLDLIDNIYFLDLLWQANKDGWNMELWLDVTILVVACVNFFMPTFALFRLRFVRFPTGLLVSDKIWALLYVLIVNGPFLGLRIYLYVLLEVQQNGRKYDPSLFAVKNVAMIYIALRELWTRLQYWRMKRRANGVRSELVANQQQPPVDDEQ